MFKAEVLAGEQPPIVERELFEAVQAKLTEQVNNHRTTRTKSEALLAGLIFDDRGNRMTPSHVRKAGIKYRYYISSSLLDGRVEEAGTVSRVSAIEIEAVVTKSVRDHLQLPTSIDDRSLIDDHVARVEVQSERLIVQLFPPSQADDRETHADSTLTIPWRKIPPTRRREILLPASAPPQHARPIRSETRATLVASIARGRRWLNELIQTRQRARAASQHARDVAFAEST